VTCQVKIQALPGIPGYQKTLPDLIRKEEVMGTAASEAAMAIHDRHALII